MGLCDMEALGDGLFRCRRCGWQNAKPILGQTADRVFRNCPLAPEVEAVPASAVELVAPVEVEGQATPQTALDAEGTPLSSDAQTSATTPVGTPQKPTKRMSVLEAKRRGLIKQQAHKPCVPCAKKAQG